ncbi:MAG: DUF3108 domain-containing protein [Phycisphaerae bacterium]|nr:DUF3108 domain-containing protein [Phycisphaerae bacterium]
MKSGRFMIRQVVLVAAVGAIFCGVAFADQPKVVRMIPENGDQNVSPSLNKIEIEFDQDMNKGGMSLCGGGENFPKIIGKPRWINVRTFAARVKLEPQHEYSFSINCPSAQNFKSASGEAAEITPVNFKTAATSAAAENERPKSANAMLQEGIYAEETEGDLDKAIGIYEQLVEDERVYERIAAQATLRLGMCYLKMGDKEQAAKYFKKAENNYPGQEQIVAQAKEQLAKLPAVENSVSFPQIVSTNPTAFSNGVDPSLDKITVTFNTEMMDQSWSWTGGGDTYPQTTSRPYYDQTRTTCTLPVKLEAGKVYWVGINSPSHKNFKTPNRTPVRWYIILFATKGEDGSPTPIPQEMLDRVKSINKQAMIQPQKFNSQSQIQELSHDDGKRAGRESIAFSGHSVKFESPGQSCFLKAVRIYGSRYGTDQPPQEDFHIYVCDENFKPIADLAFPYSRFQKGDKDGNPKGWVALNIDRAQMPTELPSTFFISVDFKPERTKGVYVYYDAASSGDSYIAVPGQELKPFDRGDWMIRAVVEQQEGAGIAAQTPTEEKEPELEAAPWVDGEVMRLNLATMAGMDIGEIIYTAKAEKNDSGQLWVIESFMNVPISNTQQYTLVEADAESFEPIFGLTKNEMGEFSAEYGDNKVELTVKKNGKENTQTFTPQQTVFDNEQALYLIRRMPLKEGYIGSFYIFPVQSASVCKARIEVKGRETRTVPCGKFDCWKVSLAVYAGVVKALEHTLWISADEHRYLVRYDSGQAVMELRAVALESDKPQQVTIDSAEFTLPVGWYAMKNPAVGGYRLSVQLISPQMEYWSVFTSAERIAMFDSARAVAQMDIEQLKGFFKNYDVRENSWQDLTIDNMQAVNYAADYMENDANMVEYRTYILGSGVYWFVFRTPADKFDQEKPVFDLIIKSFTVNKQ